jgi:protein-S-isoprenylcysteine O-methyltransferase Ste14
MLTNRTGLSQRLVIAQFGLFAALLVVFMSIPRVTEGPLLYLGFGLILAGGILIARAIYQHKQVNNANPDIYPDPSKGRALVMSGVYAYVRHPIYTGVLIVALGAALAHGSLYGFLIVLALAILFTVKSMYEERLLRQQYPEYQDYQKRTGRFLPLWIKRG